MHIVSACGVGEAGGPGRRRGGGARTRRKESVRVVRVSLARSLPHPLSLSLPSLQLNFPADTYAELQAALTAMTEDEVMTMLRVSARGPAGGGARPAL